MNEDNYVYRTVGGLKRRLTRMKPEKFGDFDENWLIVLACRELTKSITYWDRVHSWRNPKHKRYLNDIRVAEKRIIKAREMKEYEQMCLDFKEIGRIAGGHIYDSDDCGAVNDLYYGRMY